MQHACSKVGGRGSLSTYREQDSEDDGLLRPITSETNRSRWGSESTGIGSGSRRGSLFDNLDKDVPMGSIKRPSEVNSMRELQQVRTRRSRGEEYLRSALSVIGTLATDITRRLDYSYYGLLEKIAALNVTIASFQELSDSTARLFDDFQYETSGLEQDIRKQIGDIHEFQPQMQKIEALEQRMRVSNTRAKALGNRLNSMQHEVDKWDKREMAWQMRTNQRIRFFWGVITTAILAVLVAILVQHWPSEEGTSGFRALPKALKLPNIPSTVLLSKHNGILQGNPEAAHSSFSKTSTIAPNGTLSTTTTGTHTAPGRDEATGSVDYDPLRIFDDI
ncbi:hypothetical protein BDV19DRAFT_383302 [Aspergillus venezuelensis]